MAEKKGILIADDMEFSRGILKMLLRTDYTVFEAANGEDALAVLEQNADKIDCMLLDIRMPGVNGYEVMECMRERGFLERIPVIALTAISDPRGHIRCYESGAFDIIEKPYDEDLLLYKVRRTIQWFSRYCQQQPPCQAPKAPASANGQMLPLLLQKVSEYSREHFGLSEEKEVQAMVASFLRTFDGCAARLEEQMENLDFAKVRGIGHDLAGFAAGSGATQLADLTLALRTCAKAGDVEATLGVIRCILALHRSCHV